MAMESIKARVGRVSYNEIENGPALGFGLQIPYTNRSIQLSPRDVFVFYTDGFTEAMNLKSEEYGDDAFLRSIESHRNKPLGDLIQGILADVDTHRAGQAISDDCAIVAFQIG